MGILLSEDYEYPLPRMYRVRQHFPEGHLDDVTGTLKRSLMRPEITGMLKPGMKVAVAAGSRGIRDIFPIVKTTVDFLREMGAHPFIVSAMGSHGGGSEKGQRAVLAGYGITEENLGVPVVTTTDTVLAGFRDRISETGERAGKVPVWFDRAASEADLIVPVNRIKLHTDFAGPIQSGLVKMLTIGLGNQKGCSLLHETDTEHFAEALLDAASVVLRNMPVGFGVAVMENAYDRTCHVEAVPKDRLIEREKELAKQCVSLMPYIHVNTADILIVDRIGKDISGAGYDPNIIGHSVLLKARRLPVPSVQRMVLTGLSRGSEGNAIGIGQFDVVTEDVLEKMDREAVYANAIAVKAPEDARIPITAKNKDEAVRIALRCCRGIDMKNPRILEIRDTADLDTIGVSEALLPDVQKDPELEILDPYDIS